MGRWSLMPSRRGGWSGIAMYAFSAWRSAFWSRFWRRRKDQKWHGPRLVRGRAQLPAFARRTAEAAVPTFSITGLPTAEREDHERGGFDAAASAGFAIGNDGNCSAQRRQPAERAAGRPVDALDRPGGSHGGSPALAQLCGNGFRRPY